MLFILQIHFQFSSSETYVNRITHDWKMFLKICELRYEVKNFFGDILKIITVNYRKKRGKY